MHLYSLLLKDFLFYLTLVTYVFSYLPLMDLVCFPPLKVLCYFHLLISYCCFDLVSQNYVTYFYFVSFVVSSFSSLPSSFSSSSFRFFSSSFLTYLVFFFLFHLSFFHSHTTYSPPYFPKCLAYFCNFSLL